MIAVNIISLVIKLLKKIKHNGTNAINRTARKFSFSVPWKLITFSRNPRKAKAIVKEKINSKIFLLSRIPWIKRKIKMRIGVEKK